MDDHNKETFYKQQQKFQNVNPNKGLSADDLIKNILAKVDTDAKISKRYNAQKNVSRASIASSHETLSAKNVIDSNSLLMPRCLHNEMEIPKVYLDLWDNVKVNNSELCDTDRLYKQLLLTNLPNNVLAQLWSFVNRSIPGQITRTEMFIMLALIALLQSNVIDPFKELYLIELPPIPRFTFPTDFQNVEAKLRSLNLSNPIEQTVFEGKEDEEFSDFKSVEPSLISSPTHGTIEAESEKINLDFSSLTSLDQNFDKILRVPNSINNKPKDKNSICETLKKDDSMSNANHDKPDIEDDFGDFYSYSKPDCDIDQDQLTSFGSNAISKQRSVLNAIDQVMHKTFNTLIVNHDEDSVIDLFHSKEGLNFAQDLFEVFQVCERIKSNLSLSNRFIQPEIDLCHSIVMEIEHKWSFILNLFRKCSIILNCDDKHVSDHNEKEDGPCSICYAICTPHNNFTFAGQTYHPSCANFWLNYVTPLLPTKVYPLE